jgi:hypothetical protein
MSSSKNDLSTMSNQSSKSPLSKSKRWFVLLLTTMLTFGSYYSFDVISPLHDNLVDRFVPSVMDEDDFEVIYNLMFTGMYDYL